MSHRPLKIVMVASEMAPYSKSGGLADVVAALPYALQKLDQEMMVITPAYGTKNIKSLSLETVFRQVPIEIDQRNKLSCSYKIIPKSDQVPIYFVSNYNFFGASDHIYNNHDSRRFYFLSLASLKLLELLNYQPDIIHCHDWHAAIIPYLLKTRYRNQPNFKKTKTLLTIHNLGYQGTKRYDRVQRADKDHRNYAIPEFQSKKFKRLNFMKRGILWADKINAVSERYAWEILSPEYGNGLDPFLKERKDDLIGITNGIDYQIFSPKTDPHIKIPFDHDNLEKKAKNKIYLQKEMDLPVSANTPIFGIASRITEHKGFDLLLEIAPILLKEYDLQIIGVGSAGRKYRQEFKKLMKQFPDKIKINLEFSVELASQIYAGSDMFLMPSRYEPCGLGQMISLRYGSIPIVRSTGGLADTIEDFDPNLQFGNGFVFNDYEAMAFMSAIIRAYTSYKYHKSWQQLVSRVMQQSFSWEIPAKKYSKLYWDLIKK